MRALERFILLQIIDERWREHLHDMDYLREGIHLRGFAQIDPLVAYKNEGFEMFTGLMNSIWEEFARYIFHVEVEVEGQEQQAPEPAGRGRRRDQLGSTGNLSTYGGGRRRPAERARGRGGGRAAPCRPASPTPRGRGRSLAASRASRRAALDEHERIGRNDPCWCGSRQEVQEVPWGVAASLRDQLKLLADYL